MGYVGGNAGGAVEAPKCRWFFSENSVKFLEKPSFHLKMKKKIRKLGKFFQTIPKIF